MANEQHGRVVHPDRQQRETRARQTPTRTPTETNRAASPSGLPDVRLAALYSRPDGATQDTTRRCYLSVLTRLAGSRPPGPGARRMLVGAQQCRHGPSGDLDLIRADVEMKHGAEARG
jgi:hypothetical protein